MTPAQRQHELFSQLAEPFTGESLFDRVPDLVFFVKNARAEYVVVNQTLVTRCGLRGKHELVGRRVDEVFPRPFGASYRAQDEAVLRGGRPVLNQLELHFYPSSVRGWCMTNKLPLLGRTGQVVGLVGTSQDLQAPSERGGDYPAVARAVRHLQENFGEPLRVRDLAAMAGLSEYQFERRIRGIFHLTAGQLLQKVRMEAALELVRATDHPIGRIAADCGYTDQSAFTRQFRLMVGVTPLKYRRA